LVEEYRKSSLTEPAKILDRDVAWQWRAEVIASSFQPAVI
jgi:hypothetical protein